MAKKPMQFQVSENMRRDVDEWLKDKDLTLSEFLRQSVRLYMILSEYMSQGYSIILRKEGDSTEKEIILP